MMNFAFMPVYYFATSSEKDDESILMPMAIIVGFILNIFWMLGNLADELQFCLFPLNFLAFLWASHKIWDSFHFKNKLFYVLIAIAITLITFVPGMCFYYDSWIIKGIMLAITLLSLCFPISVIWEIYRLYKVMRRSVK